MRPVSAHPLGKLTQYTYPDLDSDGIADMQTFDPLMNKTENSHDGKEYIQSTITCSTLKTTILLPKTLASLSRLRPNPVQTLTRSQSARL